MKTNEIDLLKGIHPGFVLERKLKEKNLRKGPFAISINAYPQILGDITKGKRGMNTALSLRIEHALGLEEGFFMTLQVHYEIKEEKRKQQDMSHPDLAILRSGLFWDTDVSKIDWQRQRKAIIQRIFERGDEQEKAEIRRFYGSDIVKKVLQELNLSHAG
ncbi:helix-turn-helix transcriptional regulator [Chryseolinea soli]|uniref:Plasmid maintenance system antidote protein n=1 Tax=Chryseolinea soli TaxID=2321403 RepID=A0A385ST50_9BACT|nr:plasmid maintenance system antidote protein [Chryseolinea soli]AYB31978.1 plasmid maintenance system antidote protein [Chryseolinea soli]